MPFLCFLSGSDLHTNLSALSNWPVFRLKFYKARGPTLIKLQYGLMLGLRFDFSFKTLVHLPLLDLPRNGPFTALSLFKR